MLAEYHLLWLQHSAVPAMNLRCGATHHLEVIDGLHHCLHCRNTTHNLKAAELLHKAQCLQACHTTTPDYNTPLFSAGALAASRVAPCAALPTPGNRPTHPSAAAVTTAQTLRATNKSSQNTHPTHKPLAECKPLSLHPPCKRRFTEQS